ncbi:Hypothetical protein PHPALM_12612 [Phytophthora palmivora]|uniref:Uncharacterized protein n=1 Tax=Phytophthora palmivora TaxID=4796 RepID=A0A2P4XZB5_9STRA|nr:Hypothetical protein PHPALM_12612 [Phytophthora palmivora]
MLLSIQPIRCFAFFCLAFIVFTTSAQKGKGTVHGDLRSSTTEWPSLKLHFTLKRNSMQVYGQPEFDVYANPIVSNDGLSVTYNGYVDFNEGSTLTRYLLVDGIAYSTMTTSATKQTQSTSSMSQCIDAKVLPPLNAMLPALNDAVPVANATLDGAKIKCLPGNLFKVTFRGLNLAVCASGTSGVHVYGSDMEIGITYLKKRVEIVAPKLNSSAKNECEKVVNSTAVTATTTALLTGDVIPESESRSIDLFGSDVDISATTCSCKSTPRPCLFIHGLGINYAEDELQDSFSYYWGNMTEHAPCCTEFKYMIWNSIVTAWTNETQQQIMCDLATSLTDTGSPTEIADTIVVTHSMGGLMLASAIANGKCTMANSTSWIATSPPMAGSMGSDYAQEACAGEHTFIMEYIGNITGQCPVQGATLSLAYESGELSSTGLDSKYKAAQEVYRTHVQAAMCSNSYSGLLSIYQPMYWLLGAALPHKSGENDGMVEFTSCAGGLPLKQFGDHYYDQFYVTSLNHADTTFYNGDGLFSSAKKPVKWFDMKGPSSDISACSRVLPESETAIREASSTSPTDNEIPAPNQEAELLVRLSSPIVPQDAAQVVTVDSCSPATTDPCTLVGPVLPQVCQPSGEEKENGDHGNNTTQKQTRHTNDPGVQTIKAIEFSEENGNHRSWKVIGKLAMLAQSMNAHTIDIYHDRKLNTSRFMVHPNSKLRRSWEVMTVCLVLYVCVMIPFIIGFQFVDWSRLSGMNTFIDVYFVTDMVMTLRTGIVSNGEVVMDPKRVARKYFHSWFIVDLISNFPLVLFVPSSGKSLKIVKLQKIPKLLRIGRLLKYLREYAKYYNLIVSFLGLAMGLHLFACLWASLFNECYGMGGEMLCTNEEVSNQ